MAVQKLISTVVSFTWMFTSCALKDLPKSLLTKYHNRTCRRHVGKMICWVSEMESWISDDASSVCSWNWLGVQLPKCRILVFKRLLNLSSKDAYIFTTNSVWSCSGRQWRRRKQANCAALTRVGSLTTGCLSSGLLSTQDDVSWIKITKANRTSFLQTFPSAD